MQAAHARGVDVLIVDTAGRLHTKHNLMAELTKLRRIMQKTVPEAPQETILVIDATTGQNGLVQAKEFAEAVDISDILIAKLDGTAKGGIAFSVAKELGTPISYVGTGEKRPTSPSSVPIPMSTHSSSVRAVTRKGSMWNRISHMNCSCFSRSGTPQTSNVQHFNITLRPAHLQVARIDMFETLTDRLNETFARLGRKGRLTEQDVDDAMREVRRALLEATSTSRLPRTSSPPCANAPSDRMSCTRSPRRRR